MTAFTPQTNPNPAGRSRKLKAAQKKYQFSHTHVSPLALVDHVPMHDEFSADWILKVADLVMISLANMAELELCDDHREFHLMKHKLLRKIMTQGECVIKGVKPEWHCRGFFRDQRSSEPRRHGCVYFCDARR
jgi:hypothetical protein